MHDTTIGNASLFKALYFSNGISKDTASKAAAADLIFVNIKTVKPKIKIIRNAKER